MIPPMGAGTLVSIIIPTYNREALLRETVETVLAQTYHDWELLVVDDGSTDGTRTYLAMLADRRVRPILLEHSGNPARARNAGLRAAGGSFIAFLDSDDLWHPEKLALQIADLDAHPECGWSYTGLALVDERGQEIPPVDRGRLPPQRGWILEALIKGRAVAATSAVLVRRPLLQAVGEFDESLPLCEEIDLFVRFAEASPATAVSGPLALCRRHPGNGPWPPLKILEGRNRIYDGLLARASSRRLRRLCRRSKLRFSLAHVGSLRRAGRYPEARRALSISFPYAGSHPAWWVACLKTWLRPWLRGGPASVQPQGRADQPTVARGSSSS
jgi:glycosyltransferase involved in cell wall biosynthesis